MTPRIVVSTLAAVGLVATGAAVAVAAIPDAGGVISACYSKSGGSLHVLDAATDACGKNETLLTWNQTGVAGPAGPAGEQGPAGPAGFDGADGVSGFTRVVLSIPYPERTVYSQVVWCPSGTAAVSGGASPWSGALGQVATDSFDLRLSSPYEGASPDDGWRVAFQTAAAPPFPEMEVHLYANCAALGD